MQFTALHADTKAQLENSPFQIALLTAINARRYVAEIAGPNREFTRRREYIESFGWCKGFEASLTLLSPSIRSTLHLSLAIDDVLGELGPRPDERDHAKVHWDVTAVHTLIGKLAQR